jgi:hypothetical protein
MRGELHCPRCTAFRLFDVHFEYHRAGPAYVCEHLQSAISKLGGGQAEKVLPPSLLLARCRQCECQFTVLIFEGANGPSLAMFPNCPGGLASPNTPASVAYYLDRASRAQSVGAYSAALAMFRAALEHLLFEQGFEQKMCGAKLGALEAGIQDGTAPPWAKDLDPAYLRVLKDLGDSAIHPNDGDVSRQAIFDETLVAQVAATFVELIDAVYEAPKKKADRLASLQAARDAVKPPPGEAKIS